MSSEADRLSPPSTDPPQSGAFTLTINDLPIQLSARAQHDLTSNASENNPQGHNQGHIQANLNRVMQDILPQLEQRITQQAMAALHNNDPPVLHPAIPSSPQNPQTPPPPDPQFVINVGNNSSPDLNQNMTDQNTNEGQGQRSPVHSLRHLLRGVEGSLPFVLLVVIKLLYSHRLGILVFVGLFGTFYHANSSLRRLVTQREMRNWADSLGGLAWIIALLGANIFFIYYVFENEDLQKSLYFCRPAIDSMDLWSLFWVAGLTDFVVKFATIILKALVALLPRLILPPKKKGKYFMLLETVSQLYRSCLPIMPWVYFLQEGDLGSQWFSVILLLLFLIFKANHIWKKLKETKNALTRFRVDVSYGVKPSHDTLQAADNLCPICQDKFTDPVQLSCSHVFCEDCVSMWFDRERTCPMCRANIVDNPQWRDGSTSSYIQCY